MPEITELNSDSSSEDEFEDAVDDCITTQNNDFKNVVDNAVCINTLTDEENEEKHEETNGSKNVHAGMTESTENFLQKEMDSHFSERTEQSGENSSPVLPETETKLEYMNEEIDENALRERDESLTESELESNRIMADKMKMEANDYFKAGEFAEAIDTYTEALKICPMKCNKERAILYGNMAAAKISMDSNKGALSDCNKAIELYPDYVRVLLRRAKLYEIDDKLDEALKDYKRICELDPGQHVAREALVRLPPIIQERNERLKDEMIDKLKDLGNMFLKPFGLSTSNFQMQQDPATGSYSINFKQNQS